MDNSKDYFNDKYINRSKKLDKVAKSIFAACAIIASVSVILIILYIFYKGVQPFLPNYKYGTQDLSDFLFGSAYRSDQGIYGIGYIIINTLLISFGAVILSVPLSVITALFVSKVATKRIKKFLTATIELLASIPSIIYGVFAFGVITVGVDKLSSLLGMHSVQGLSMLSAILLLAIMIFPTITLVSITSINSVDRVLEEASLALGATKVQTNYRVVLKDASNGIFAGIILGVGRAFGEATAVSLVIGNALVGPTFNLFDPSRTLTSTILAGLKEATGLDYDIRFSIGFVLLLIILITNLVLNAVNRRISYEK